MVLCYSASLHVHFQRNITLKTRVVTNMGVEAFACFCTVHNAPMQSIQCIVTLWPARKAPSNCRWVPEYVKRRCCSTDSVSVRIGGLAHDSSSQWSQCTCPHAVLRSRCFGSTCVVLRMIAMTPQHSHTAMRHPMCVSTPCQRPGVASTQPHKPPKRDCN